MPFAARYSILSSCVLALSAVSFAACSGTDGDGSTPGAGGGTSTAGGTHSAGATGLAGASPTAGATSSGGSAATAGSTNTGGVPSTAGASSTGGASQAGAAGSSGSAGASAGAGGASPGGVCHPKFASGVNVAWFNFASDIPNPDISKFTALFKNVKAAGGSAVRWWFHTTGMTTPGYDGSGKATPISAANIADLKKILDAASAEGVGVVISIWSFGMLDSAQTSNATVLANNKLLLENDTNRQAYIDNVLTPMVTALKGYHGLFAWEIFNEPEGMTSDKGGWTNPSTSRTAAVNLQKTVNWFTSAIHNADPSALVTNGANNFSTLSPSKGTNLWSDSALVGAGSKANGTLDFYEVHYYNTYSGASANSPFLHPVSYWGLDKKVVIGEFWTDATDGVAATDLYTNLYGSDYSGAWAWQYVSVDNPGPTSGASTIWPAMQTPMNNLKTAHAADLTCP
ncbi:MAG: cellulase family glycosylhydrolase [Polyangiaceae bacterium]